MCADQRSRSNVVGMCGRVEINGIARAGLTVMEEAFSSSVAISLKRCGPDNRETNPPSERIGRDHSRSGSCETGQQW